MSEEEGGGKLWLKKRRRGAEWERETRVCLDWAYFCWNWKL